MLQQRWFQYALLSAVSAAAVGIFGKLGLRHVDPTLATAVRSVIMAVLLVTVCFTTGLTSRLGELDGRALLMIALSGIAGAASWLFYFRALQAGELSQVAPVDKLSVPLGILLAVLVLGERPSGINWLGIGLALVGVYLASMPSKA
ncbi:EamA family transporter [Humisphaera borealis]|uniref:EamA family transporter n=1 Tax=Humisphaera borealis TaxID=2807512 RepID=A0A7M2X301_9BACT|nr:EamA family transporter [Humisphaera borealis]QOV92055.1 EamA family transporter [Humisphaera borealis]